MSVPVHGISDPEFRDALRKTRTVIIPVGSLEQHGPHLPVSTDSIISEYLAKQVADRIGAFVLPVISYGVSFEHGPMFNVSVRHEVLSRMISDACISLAQNGLRKIILLNGHHGNLGALQYTSQEIHAAVSRNVHVYTFHYWHMLDAEFDHAGLVETSLLLAISPELVRMDRAAPNSRRLAKSKLAYSSMTNEPGAFPRLTGNGVWGDPRKSGEKKGREFLDQIISRLTETISQL